MLLAAVTVAGVAIPAAAPASASLPLVPGPANSLSDAFQNSTPTFLQALLCPVGKVVKTLTSTIPGVNTLTDQLSNLLCALSVLGYAYRTTYYPPSGPPVVRYYRALVGVPALLDVDGNGLPDYSGTVTTTVNVIGLQFDLTRIGVTPSNRVKIEAVFLDPADQTTWVGLGEDGSINGTAKYWRASVGLFGLSGQSIDLGVDFFAQNAPASLAALGEVFFGDNPDAPTAIDRGTMNFAPVPTNFSTRLRIGPDSQTANISSTIPTVLTANVQVIKPGDEKDIDVTVNQLPTSIELFHQSTGGHELVTYSANNVIAHLTGAYHDRAGSNILTAAQIDITNLPTAFSLDQSDGVTNFNVPSGAIGNVEVRFATGQDVPASPAGTDPYLAFHRFSSSHLTAGVRMGNIKSLSFDQRGPYVGDIVFSTAPGLIPFSAQDDVSGITATGHLSNLPAHLTVTIDLAGGHVVFDGHGTGIDAIVVNATRNPGVFFTRANRIDLTILGLPALDTIDFAPDGTSVNFTPSAPIGSVSFLASDGTAAPVVSGDYASYEDTPSLYRLYVQMFSIAGASFSTSPTMSATLKTGVSQPMLLFAHIANAALTHDITFNGAIKNLPTSITVTADLNNGKVVYNASSAINEIDASARDSLANFFGRVNRLDLVITGLPQTNTITFLPNGQAVTFTPSSPIGSVSLLASDGTAAPVPSSGDYASYEDTPSLFRIFLQMQSIAGVQFAASPTITATLKTGVSQEMDLFAHIKNSPLTHDITFNGAIKNLPTNITVTADVANGQFVYNANSTINEIDVSAHDAAANFFGRVNTVAATIKGLPQTNTINFLPSGTQVQFTPSSPIGSVSLLASDGTGAPVVSGDYASYEDTPTLYRIFVQMVGIAGLTFNTNPLSGELLTSSPQLMTLHGRLKNGSFDITADGTIDQLPSDISFALGSSGGNTSVDYNTHGQVVNNITLDASGVPLPFGADTVHALIQHLPSHITAVIPTAGGTASFDPHGDHINRVLVQAYPHASGAVNAAAGHQLAYANLHTGQFTADIHNIGYTSFSTDASNININYDVSSEPLDFELDTADGTQYFKGQISNPEPAGIHVDTANGVKINYQVNPSSTNFTGNGEINQIAVQTNVFGGYLNATLQHIAPKLEICFDSGGSTKCLPTNPAFVPTPGQYFTDNHNNQWLMPNSSFDFHVIPTTLGGAAWPTRFRLDGTVCFSEPDAATCLNSGNDKERVVLSDLEFGKIQAGVGTAEDGCTLCTAGRIYGYFDTDNTPITGDVQYFKGGDDDPFVHYSQDSGSGDSVQAQNFFLFAQYCAPCINADLLDLVTGGSFSCTGSPHLDINTFVDVDVFSGSLIHVC